MYEICATCNHSHATMAGSSSHIAGEWVDRYYCHESDHSCYQNHQLPATTKEGLISWLDSQGAIDTVRDRERIESFLEKLLQYWLTYPDLRFGQLVMNLKLDNYNREDEDALDLIDNQLHWKEDTPSTTQS